MTTAVAAATMKAAGDRASTYSKPALQTLPAPARLSNMEP